MKCAQIPTAEACGARFWKVDHLDLSRDAQLHPACGAGVWYPFHVTGHNIETGLCFSWAVPCVCGNAFDLSSALLGEGVVDWLASKGITL